MKLKSLLLGSAAVLVAVSGAQAADAIVVEAEPVEYVKVCDTYGAGYFYIPGTETCLKFGGEVRVQYTKNFDHDDAEVSDHGSDVRLRFTIDAKNETEYGTLSSSARVSWTRAEFDQSTSTSVANLTTGVVTTTTTTSHDAYSTPESSAGGAGLDYAQISLAGFTTGYNTQRILGKAWNTAIDSKANFFDYTYTAGDLALIFGIQDSARSGAAGQPDVYVRADYSAGDLSVGGFAVLDTDTDDVAYGVDASYSLASFIPGGKITAFWEGDGYDSSKDVHGGGTEETGTDYAKGHMWGVKLDYKLTDSISGHTRYSERDGYINATNIDATERKWRTGLKWSVASGFAVEALYKKTLDNYGAAVGSTGSNGTVEINFIRSF